MAVAAADLALDANHIVMGIVAAALGLSVATAKADTPFAIISVDTNAAPGTASELDIVTGRENASVGLEFLGQQRSC